MRDLLARHSSRLLTTLASLVILATTSPAEADFLFGKELSIQVFDPNLNSPIGPLQTFTANGTDNVNLSGGTIVNVDLIVNDTTIEFIYNQTARFDTGAFNGYVIKDVSTDIPPFTGLKGEPRKGGHSANRQAS